MPLPITLTVAYLAINLAMMIWLERERALRRPLARGVGPLAIALRFGPPLVGLAYLVTIAGDWLFFGFVIAFFAGSFWLMSGLLAFTTPPRGSDAWRSRGWDDRSVGAPSNSERDHS